MSAKENDCWDKHTNTQFQKFISKFKAKKHIPIYEKQVVAQNYRQN